MKTFQEFVLIAEASYDAEFRSGAQVSRGGAGVKIGAERKKTAPERRRMKAVGGGKMEPAKEYKQRSDVGQQRGSQAPKLQAGTAGTKGSAALTAKQRQRKAYLERKAKESGKSQPETASQALAQSKPKPAAKPAAQPRKKWEHEGGGGMTRAERDKARNKQKGEALKARKAELIKDFTEKHGRAPKGVERTKLLGLAHSSVKAGV